MRPGLLPVIVHETRNPIRIRMLPADRAVTLDANHITTDAHKPLKVRHHQPRNDKRNDLVIRRARSCQSDPLSTQETDRKRHKPLEIQKLDREKTGT